MSSRAKHPNRCARFWAQQTIKTESKDLRFLLEPPAQEGLALARQIVEAHGGAIELRNRPNHQGCTAEVRIPVAERSRT
jgi:hypothetical protein